MRSDVSISTAVGAVLLATLAALSTPTKAAASFDFCNPGYTVGFFNGVFNTRRDAESATKALKPILGSTYKEEPVKFKVFYNVSGQNPDRPDVTRWEDIAEVFKQKRQELWGLLSDRWSLLWEQLSGGSWDWDRLRRAGAAAAEVADALLEATITSIVSAISGLLSNPPTAQTVAEQVGMLNDEIDRGRKLLLVAHSQGNLFVNAAYDATIGRTTIDAMKVVHIAPAAATARGRYTTVSNDNVIARLLRATSAGGVLPANHTPTEADNAASKDLSHHTLLQTYLDPAQSVSAKVIQDLRTTLDELQEPPLPQGKYRLLDLILPAMGQVFAATPITPERASYSEWPHVAHSACYVRGTRQMHLDRLQAPWAISFGRHLLYDISHANNLLPLKSKRKKRWCGVADIKSWDGTADAESFAPPLWSGLAMGTPLSWLYRQSVPPLPENRSIYTGGVALEEDVVLEPPDQALRRALQLLNQPGRQVQTIFSTGPVRRVSTDVFPEIPVNYCPGLRGTPTTIDYFQSVVYVATVIEVP